MIANLNLLTCHLYKYTRIMLEMFFLIKNNEATENGSPVYCRLSVNNTKTEISAKVRVNADWWDVDSKKITAPSGASSADKKQAKEYNEKIELLKDKIKSAYKKLSSLDDDVSALDVKSEVLGKNVKKTIEDAFGILKRRALMNDNHNQLKKIESYSNYFMLFMQETYNKKLSFSEIAKKTDISLSFSEWAKKRGWKSTYTKKIFSYFRRAINEAYKVKWIKEQIFVDNIVVNRKEIVRKDVLTMQELNLIKDKDFENESLQRIADIFVFQCCTGLAYIDVKNLKWDDLQTDQEGNVFVAKPRQKSAQEFIIPINDTAMELINKYKTDSHRRVYYTEHIFPVKSNGKTNEYLKIVADMCGIDKSLSTHVARYTYNQLLYEAGVSDEIRKQILGHSTVSMTAHYTSAKAEIISNEVKKLKF